MAAAVDNPARDFECIRFDHASGKVTAREPRAIDVLDRLNRVGSRAETKILSERKPEDWRWNNTPPLAQAPVTDYAAHSRLRGDTGRP